MPTATEFAVSHLAGSQAFTMKLLADVPGDKLAAQFPGVPNHFLWTTGHLGLSCVFFGSCIGAAMPEIPAGWDKLFSPGSQPSARVSDYPPLEELVAFYTKAHAAFEAKARTLTDADLAAACPNGGGGFLKNQMAALLAVAWHEAWHGGQLSNTRRGLGLSGVFGM